MMAANFGAVAGYTLSGIMITFFGWRSMFLINVPSVFSGRSGLLPFKRDRDKNRGTKIRLRRFNTVLYWIIDDSTGFDCGKPTSTRNIAILAVGLVFFIAVIFVELRQRYPPSI